jgi:hypothetical protein
MSDLISCPNCGLSQSAQHAFCARCDHSFATTGPTPAVADELIAPGAGIESGEYPATDREDRIPTVQRDAPRTPTPRDRGGAEGTPTSGTPTDRGARRPTSLDSMEAAPDDATASTTMESEAGPAGPAGPSWNMPGRDVEARADAFPAAPLRGVGRDKRSLSARGRGTPGGPGPAARGEGGDAGLDGAALGRVSQPGGRPGGELRGRPPGNLFASENSLPPGDPLMAALVSGEALRADSIPEIDFGTSHPGAAVPLNDAPPVQRDFDVDSGANVDAVEPDGPRVVAPSRGRRSRSTAGHRSRPGGLLPDGPDAGRSVAPPNAATQVRPTLEREGGDAIPDEPSAPGQLSVELPPPARPSRVPTNSRLALTAGSVLPPVAAPRTTTNNRAASLPPGLTPPGRTPRRTTNSRAASIPPAHRSTPASVRPDPRQSSLIDGRAPDDLPLPPPPDLPADRGVDPALVRRGVKIAAFLATLLVLGLAALDMSSMLADVGALRATLNANIRSDGLPTPDLPRMLDRAVDELDLGDQLVSQWATISAADDRFRVGVEVEHSVVGLPQRTRIEEEGAFVVSEQLRTLEFYLAEWQLDAAGTALLEQEKQRRERR